QLYVNLRGSEPSSVHPAEAIRDFLGALLVSSGPLPAPAAPLPAQTALFRSLTAGRRMLLLLDDARDSGQVRPLLPGAPGCMVVVTGRSRLTGLIATEGG